MAKNTDNILNKYGEAVFDDWITEWTVASTKANQALYSDILELIGEDESGIDKGAITIFVSNEPVEVISPFKVRNDFRQHLRQALKEYFGIKDTNGKD